MRRLDRKILFPVIGKNDFQFRRLYGAWSVLLEICKLTLCQRFCLMGQEIQIGFKGSFYKTSNQLSAGREKSGKQEKTFRKPGKPSISKMTLYMWVQVSNRSGPRTWLRWWGEINNLSRIWDVGIGPIWPSSLTGMSSSPAMRPGPDPPHSAPVHHCTLHSGIILDLNPSLKNAKFYKDILIVFSAVLPEKSRVQSE